MFASDCKESFGSTEWRTINGDECSGYWPAGTAAVHIAGATARHLAATCDERFETECGAELLVETARLWVRLGHHLDGVFRIDGVTGPDEYTAIVHNNIYTNLAAQQNLRDAVAVCLRRPDLTDQFDVDPTEISAWQRCADHMYLPYDDRRRVHQQSEHFTTLAAWDFDESADKYPLLLHYPYYDLYRKQVVKQADLVLAMYLRGDAFTAEQKRRNFDYYEPLTVRDSSLSACGQAVLAAEVGYLDLAYNHLVETAFTDLHDLHDNVSNGLHIAALVGTWHACVAGFGGMRDHNGDITFAPCLPPAMKSGPNCGCRVAASTVLSRTSTGPTGLMLPVDPVVSAGSVGSEVVIGCTVSCVWGGGVVEDDAAVDGAGGHVGEDVVDFG